MLDDLQKIGEWEKSYLFEGNYPFQVFKTFYKDENNAIQGIIIEDLKQNYEDYILFSSKSIRDARNQIIYKLHRLYYIPQSIFFNNKKYKLFDFLRINPNFFKDICLNKFNIKYKIGNVLTQKINNKVFLYAEYAFFVDLKK